MKKLSLILIIGLYIFHSALASSIYQYRIELKSLQVFYFRNLAKLMQSESQSEGAVASSDLKVELTLSGVLSVFILQESASTRLIAIQVVPRSLILRLNGELPPASDQAALRRELEETIVYAQLTVQGKVQAIWLYRGGPFSHGIARTMVALLQVVQPESPQEMWEVSEEAPEGAFLVRYRVERRTASVWEIQKQRLHAMEVAADTFPVAYNLHPQGDLRIAYDPMKQLIRRVEGTIRLLCIARSQTLAESTTSVLMHQTDTIPLAERRRTQLLVHYRSILTEKQPLRGTPLGGLDERQQARQILGQETYASLKKALAQLPDNAEMSQLTALSQKWRALIILDESVIDKVVQQLRSLSFKTARAQVLIVALSQSNRTAAQQALCRLADFFLQRRDYDSYHYYVACLGLLEFPSESVLHWLIKRAQSPSLTVARPALLALGAVGRSLQRVQKQNAANAALKTILKQLQKAQSEKEIEVALCALGNLGHPDALPVLEPFLHHPDATLRAAATFSLRYIEQAKGERLLLQMLQDPAHEVRLEAITALGYRRLSDALLPELTAYLQREPQKVLRRTLIEVLWQQRNHLQGLRTLLAQIATHDPDEEVRLYAQALLQQLP